MSLPRSGRSLTCRAAGLPRMPHASGQPERREARPGRQARRSRERVKDPRLRVIAGSIRLEERHEFLSAPFMGRSVVARTKHRRCRSPGEGAGRSLAATMSLPRSGRSLTCRAAGLPRMPHAPGQPERRETRPARQPRRPRERVKDPQLQKHTIAGEALRTRCPRRETCKRRF